MYAASRDEASQRTAATLFGDISGSCSPGLSPVWQSEPATLTLLMDTIRKRLTLLVDAIDVKRATWRDTSRLAVALNVASGLVSLGYCSIPRSRRFAIVDMPPSVWIDAGRLAHTVRSVLPDVKDAAYQPGSVSLRLVCC